MAGPPKERPLTTREPSTRVSTPSAYIRRLQAGEGVAATITEQGTDDFHEEYELADAIEEAKGVTPQSVTEARRLPEREQWDTAMKKELETLKKMGTWVKIRKQDVPKGTTIIGSKWVYRIKTDAEGKPIAHKARLVAQGFSQIQGVHFFETYSPVAKLASTRMVLAIAAQLDLEIHQIDVVSAYLNGELDDGEIIYMKEPPGFAESESGDGGGWLLRLLRPLYGLKQSGRKWYEKFSRIMTEELGFTRCDIDQGVFFKRSEMACDGHGKARSMWRQMTGAT
jgi:hypothetical protein